MDSFFTVFLNKFNDKAGQGQHFGGEYVALILREVLDEHPELLESINKNFCQGLKLRKGILTSKTEESFPSSTKAISHRLADLCFTEESGKKLFVEIKWEDDFSEGQFQDYLKIAKTKNNFFSLLTLNDKFPDEKKKLNGTPNQYVLFSDLLKDCLSIYERLKKPKKDTGLMKLFINFLEDHTMNYRTEIDEKALLTLMKSSIGLKNTRRTRSHDSTKNIPEVWKRLLDNLEVLGDRFHNEFSQTGVYGDRPFPRFGFNSVLPSDEKLEKVIRKRKSSARDDPDTPLILASWSNIEAESGSFYFENSIRIQRELYARFGFHFQWDDPVGFFVNAGFARSFYDEAEIKIRKKSKKNGSFALPEVDDLYRKMLSLLKAQIKEWIKDNQGHKNKELVKSCQTLFNALQKKY